MRTKAKGNKQETGTGPMVQPFHLLCQGSDRSNDVVGIICLDP